MAGQRSARTSSRAMYGRTALLNLDDGHPHGTESVGAGALAGGHRLISEDGDLQRLDQRLGLFGEDSAVVAKGW